MGLKALTTIFKTTRLQALKDFAKGTDALAIVKRKVPKGADVFFNKLMQKPFGIAGKVCKGTAVRDIKNMLASELPSDTLRGSFYNQWYFLRLVRF